MNNNGLGNLLGRALAWAAVLYLAHRFPRTVGVLLMLATVWLLPEMVRTSVSQGDTPSTTVGTALFAVIPGILGVWLCIYVSTGSAGRTQADSTAGCVLPAQPVVTSSVVYYVACAGLVKIGTTLNLAVRMAALQSSAPVRRASIAPRGHARDRRPAQQVCVQPQTGSLPVLRPSWW